METKEQTKNARVVADLKTARTSVWVENIDNHGSYEKHVLGINNPNGKEYGSLFESRDQWKGYISKVITHPSENFIGMSKDLYWDNKLGTVVIDNKTGGAPTAFRPQQGKAYYETEVGKQKEKMKGGVKP